CSRSVRRPRTPTLVPYTTLFRSKRGSGNGEGGHCLLRVRARLRVTRSTADDSERHRRAHRLAGNPDRTGGKGGLAELPAVANGRDRKSTRLNSSHVKISYAVFCL